MEEFTILFTSITETSENIEEKNTLTFIRFLETLNLCLRQKIITPEVQIPYERFIA